MRWNPTKEEHYYQILKVLEPWVPKKQLEAWLYEVMEKFKRRDRIQYILMQVRMKAVLKLLAGLRPDARWGQAYVQLGEAAPPKESRDIKSIKKLQSLYWKFFDTYADPSQPLWEDEVSLNVMKPIFAPKYLERLSAEDEETLWNKLQSEYEELEHLMDTMETGHFQTALNIIWTDQPINDMSGPTGGHDPLLIRQLQEAIDKDRSEVETQFIPLEEMASNAGTLFIQCGDNLAWYALLTPAQRKIEARLMNHCAAPQHGIILSLREFVPNRGLRPHLTFEYILGCDPPTNPEDFNYFFGNAVGILGEMKGYGNSKPASRYHNAILCLLALPNILAVVGGSYLSDHDFALTDLSEADRARLSQIRPELFNDDLLITHRAEALVWWLKKHYPQVTIQDGVLVDQKFGSSGEALQYVVNQHLLNECYSDRGSIAKQFERLVHLQENPGEFDFWIENYGCRELSEFFRAMQSPQHRKHYTQFLGILRSRSPQLADEIIQHIEDGEWGEIPEEISDPIETTARMAESIGWESGTLSAMARELDDILPLETQTGLLTKDGITTTPSRLFKALARGDAEDNTISNEECQRVRRIVWRASETQDFDANASFEFFVDRLHEEL